ncbi:MAG: hypothetical protein ACR2F1_05220 [Nitrososphaeraceae archaeon]
MSTTSKRIQNNNDLSYQTLPNMVRSLPNTVRFLEPRKRSTRLSYQGTRETICSFDNEFWNNFEEYLVKSYRKSSVRCGLLYAKKYFTIIKEENAQSLLALSYNKRLQVMKSLAILSKFLGCYDRWKQIKERLLSANALASLYVGNIDAEPPTMEKVVKLLENNIDKRE